MSKAAKTLGCAKTCCLGSKQGHTGKPLPKDYPHNFVIFLCSCDSQASTSSLPRSHSPCHLPVCSRSSANEATRSPKRGKTFLAHHQPVSFATQDGGELTQEKNDMDSPDTTPNLKNHVIYSAAALHVLLVKVNEALYPHAVHSLDSC